MTGLDLPDAGPVPAELVAATVNTYVVALVRPVTTSLWTLPTVMVGSGVWAIRTYGVITYPVIVPPPLEAGGDQVTVALAGPRGCMRRSSGLPA